MGPCLQKPGFEKDDMLGNIRKHSTGMSLFREFATILHICWQTVFGIGFEPMACSGPGPSPAANASGSEGAPVRATLRCPVGPFSGAPPTQPSPGSEKASIQTESEKSYSSKGGKLTTMEISISICRKKTNREISNIPVCRNTTRINN